MPKNVCRTGGKEVRMQHHNCLWYKQPAKKFSEALPFGNGSLGGMQLWERGELDLLDPVSRYIPAFAEQIVGDERRKNPQPMTIYHLLSMTSGLTYGGTDSENGRQTQALFDEISSKLSTDQEMSTLEVAQRLAAIPLAFLPGSHWCYGTSADILGAIVEVVSGKSLRDYLKDELFSPLGMLTGRVFQPSLLEPTAIAPEDTRMTS